MPLVGQTVPAHQRDVTTLLPLLVHIPAVRGKPGSVKQGPAAIVADKGVDDESLRRLLRCLGMKPQVPRRGEENPGLGVWRWFVERTISWLHQFRRLRIRWDRRREIHQAFLTVAVAIICYRLWMQPN